VTVFLIRHALAGNRDEWEEADDIRPLSKKGQRQAERIAELLAHRGIERIVSSPSLRCVQSVQPLADRLDLEVETSESLAEGVDADDVVALFRSVRSATTALCTHGDVIPTLLDALVERDGLLLPRDYPCAKGSSWECEQDDWGRAVSAMYLPAP
jgi:broad specificity phosphatase PhoE